MTTHRNTHALLIALVAALVAGCASSPSRFYKLNSTAKADGAPTAHYTVSVGPVIIPAAVDRPQFLVQLGPNRVAVEEFNRWATPLNASIAAVVAADLAVLLGTPQVTTAPTAGFEPAYRVTLQVQQFESWRTGTGKNEAASIEAVWVVRKTAGGAARSGHTAAREPAEGTDFDALAAAHSRALAKVSTDIANAIRQAEAQP